MNDQESLKCKNCGEDLESDWDVCPCCGTPTPIAQLLCPGCSRPVKPKWKLCPKCKMALDGYMTPTGLPGSCGTPAGKGSSEADDQSDASNLFVTKPLTKRSQPEPGQIEIPQGELLHGRFLLQHTLGVGGFGTVYLAQDQERKQEIALKVAICGYGQSEFAADQLRQELAMRDRITDFQHIIRTYDIHPAKYKNLQLILMPMEYAKLGNLRNWLIQHRRDVERRRTEGLELFKQACLGIQAIHEVGLAHLDLKPENLLLCQGNNDELIVKVSDFGISRNVEHISLNQASITQEGLGTPTYKSPEQFLAARQEDVEAPSDIYSLGVILFETLDKHGKPPFDGHPQQLRDKHLDLKPPNLKDVDATLCQVVSLCLAKKPEDRPSSVARVLDALVGETNVGQGEREEEQKREEYEIALEKLDEGITISFAEAYAGCTREIQIPIDEQRLAKASLRIPPGCPDGLIMDVSRGGQETGIYVRIHVERPIDKWRVEGADLYVEQEVPDDAENAHVELPDGSRTEIQLSDLHRPSDVIRIAGQGLLNVHGNRLGLADPQPDRGDLYIQCCTRWGAPTEVLLLAVVSGHELEVKRNLAHGEDVNMVDVDGNMLLHYAACNGHADVVRVLCENHAEINAKNHDGKTPLEWAAERGHGTVVRVLLEHQGMINVDASDEHGQTQLHFAATQGYSEIIRVFCENGAAVNAKDISGKTALHIAAGKGDIDIVRILCEYHADIEARDQTDETPLHPAAGNGHAAVISVLCEHGADVNAKQSAGWTPLFCAKRRSRQDVIQLLLRHGADNTACTTIATENLRGVVINGPVQEIQMNLDLGADVNASESGGRTMLHRASWKGNADAVRILCEHGADIKAKDKYGGSPLNEAARQGHVEVVRVLCEHGGDPSARDAMGRTPLHSAVETGTLDVVRFLLDQHVDVNARMDNKMTPLQCAEARGNSEMVQLLLQRLPNTPSMENTPTIPLPWENEDGQGLGGGQLGADTPFMSLDAYKALSKKKWVLHDVGRVAGADDFYYCLFLRAKGLLAKDACELIVKRGQLGVEYRDDQYVYEFSDTGLRGYGSPGNIAGLARFEGVCVLDGSCRDLEILFELPNEELQDRYWQTVRHYDILNNSG